MRPLFAWVELGGLYAQPRRPQAILSGQSAQCHVDRSLSHGELARLLDELPGDEVRGGYPPAG